MEPEKKIVIIAGPTGAGKTTFARCEFLPNEAGCATGAAPPHPCPSQKEAPGEGLEFSFALTGALELFLDG